MTWQLWEAAVGFVLHEETPKYTDHATDLGGATRHGISIRFAGSIGLDIDGDGDVDKDDIRALTVEHAKAAYREHFWNPMRCDELPSRVAFVLFDCAVNQGNGAAAVLLQAAAGVVRDGNIGPKTLAAVAARPAFVLEDLVARRAHRYATTKTFESNGLGWMRRLTRVHAFALSL